MDSSSNLELTTNNISTLTFDKLPELQQKKALQLLNQLKESDASSVISFGSNVQGTISTFSQHVLKQAQAQDLGEVGETLSSLMLSIRDANPNDLASKSGIISKIFKKVNRTIDETQIKYQSLGAGIDQIALKLDRHSIDLITDSKNLETLYEQNYKYYIELQNYIGAGELKLNELRQTLIPTAHRLATKNTENLIDVQKVRDLESYYSRLDKRVMDFKITRQLTIQQAPQIRLIQDTNQALAEKIKSSINIAIPLWKNQVAIALTLLKQKDALISQKLVSDTTNELLLKNSESLKLSTIESAIENERSIIDIDTLKTTQQNLIDTIEETLRIQLEGQKSREQSNVELIAMENEMKTKLLQLSK